MTWRAKIATFLAEYAWRLDNDKLEEWLELFPEQCRYEILSKENESRGLDLALLTMDNKAMLRDRISALRGANEYKIHYDRHVIGPAKILAESESEVRFEANFCVYESDQEGNTKIFSVGCYRAHLVETPGAVPQAREVLAVVDTFCVRSMLSTPI